MKRLPLLGVCVLLVVVSGLLTAIYFTATKSRAGGEVSGAAAGPAPDFRLETLAHGRFYLNQQRGKVVILIFWETICIPCKREMIDLKSLSAEYTENELTIAAVCADPENRDAVSGVAKEFRIQYAVLLDEGKQVGKSYKATAYPTTIIIDQEGQVVFRRVGYDDTVHRQIRTKVEDLRSKKAQP